MLEMRKIYLDHMKKMFTMIGQTPEQAGQSAATVLKIETALAKAFMDRTLRRDPKNIDHKMALADIAVAPNFHLDRYFTGNALACIQKSSTWPTLIFSSRSML